MNRTLLGIGLGVATLIGGFYLYKKYGGGRKKDLVARVGGAILGDKVGAVAGHLVAGPAGAFVGSVVGSVSGAMAAEEFLLGE